MKNRSHICPITYDPIEINAKYSIKGLRLLSPKLQDLKDLPYSAEQQRTEANERSDKMSIQGVQPKLNARLNLKEQSFEICDIGGTFILKPQHQFYPELPENEALSMRMAADVMEVPLHGLLYCVDGRFTYFIKRFDRIARRGKIPVEDFGQLIGLDRDTKYEFSMEKIVSIIDQYCTFPAIEKTKLFTRVIFNYLIGNEDMHLKNYSVITMDKITKLAPAYDLINTTIAIGNAKEQIALPLNGKKNNLTRKDLVEYYGQQRLGLSMIVINDLLNNFSKLIPKWRSLIDISFLSAKHKESYHAIFDNRIKILKI